MSKTWPQKTNGPNREISALATCKTLAGLILFTL